MKRLFLTLGISLALLSCSEDDLNYVSEVNEQPATKVFYEKLDNGFYSEISREDVMAKHQILSFQYDYGTYYNVYFKGRNQVSACSLDYFYVNDLGEQSLMFSVQAPRDTRNRTYTIDENYFYTQSCP